MTESISNDRAGQDAVGVSRPLEMSERANGGGSRLGSAKCRPIMQATQVSAERVHSGIVQRVGAAIGEQVVQRVALGAPVIDAVLILSRQRRKTSLKTLGCQRYLVQRNVVGPQGALDSLLE